MRLCLFFPIGELFEHMYHNSLWKERYPSEIQMLDVDRICKTCTPQTAHLHVTKYLLPSHHRQPLYFSAFLLPSPLPLYIAATRGGTAFCYRGREGKVRPSPLFRLLLSVPSLPTSIPFLPHSLPLTYSNWVWRRGRNTRATVNFWPVNSANPPWPEGNKTQLRPSRPCLRDNVVNVALKWISGYLVPPSDRRE